MILVYCFNKEKLALDEFQKRTVQCFKKKAKVKRKLIYREIVGKFFPSICISELSFNNCFFLCLQIFIITFMRERKITCVYK